MAEAFAGYNVRFLREAAHCFAPMRQLLVAGRGWGGGGYRATTIVRRWQGGRVKALVKYVLLLRSNLLFSWFVLVIHEGEAASDLLRIFFCIFIFGVRSYFVSLEVCLPV